ncbi:hypothetical protein AYL99_11654 [Fonsecaea erecta]|uniref:HNH nuclease domain-containing protein n=1 Tax=Fonsecaea erecta TaxID=1367422 RepID=A0A178Z2T9_9EURO|nr:hypothetical protein AYL99_11654 [Fonsecaea erecta]OAP54119.1 hypothetical protein AYL99_11654 [Fonsecaea erecta]
MADSDMCADKRSNMRQSLSPAFDDPRQDSHTPSAIRKRSESVDNEPAELEISDFSDEPVGDDPRTTSFYIDPLQDFQTPLAIRKISEYIDNKSTELEGRIRKISDFSDQPIGDEPEMVSLYIDQRQALVDEVEAHYKESRKIAREAYTGQSQGIEELQRALTQLDDTHIILKERTALAANRMRVQYSVLGRRSSGKIGKAYMMAIKRNLPEPTHPDPACLLYEKQPGRSEADQISFRNRLIKAYNPEGSKLLTEPQESQLAWCPISGKEFPAEYIKAVHIIPSPIGETNAATYLFGAKPREGYDIICSEKNGLMMELHLEKIFDDGRMLIMPDPTDDNEFISIVLCQHLKKVHCWAIDAPYGALHRRRLQFRTAARPGKRYLYMHALLTLFRRRRYNMPGWETDREEVFLEMWATPTKWARKSMMEVLAVEMGDDWGSMEGLGLGEFPHVEPPEEEKRMAKLVKYAWEARASNMDDEDDDDDDDDE